MKRFLVLLLLVPGLSYAETSIHGARIIDDFVNIRGSATIEGVGGLNVTSTATIYSVTISSTITWADGTKSTTSVAGGGSAVTFTIPQSFPAGGKVSGAQHIGAGWDNLSGAADPSLDGWGGAVVVLNFDPDADETAYLYLPVPLGWDGTAPDIRLFGAHANPGGANIRWDITTACSAPDETALSWSDNAVSSATATSGGSNDWWSHTFTSVPITNCSAGEIMRITVMRDATDAADTLTINAGVANLQITWRYASD
jgi:hypothetical protein